MDAFQQQPCDLARRWVEAFGAQRDDELVELAHPEIVIEARWGSGAGSYRAHEGVRAWLAAVGTVRPPVTLVSVETLRDGRALTQSRIEGATAIGIFEIRDGRISAVAGYLSDRALLEAVGVIVA